jgi:hypothetical protein
MGDRYGVVTMMSLSDNATIYSTFDGFDPTVSSFLYRGPFTKVNEGTIKARTFAEGMLASRTTVLHLDQLAVITPVIFPYNTYFADSAMVTISCETKGADIYYTISSSQPTKQSIRYNKPFTITRSTTIRAIAFKKGYRPSLIASSTIEIKKPSGKGVNFRYYEGAWEKMPDFTKLTPLQTGTVSQIGFKGINTRKEKFALLFSGFINIAQADSYTFYLESNDGSRLFIDAREVVDNSGQHGAIEKQPESGKV